MDVVDKKRWVFKPALGYVLACALYASWLAYKGLGVFIGSIRADEIHFLQNAWMAYSGQPSLEYIPPLYHYLLQFAWSVFEGDLQGIYTLRIFNFALFCIQGGLVYGILRNSFWELKGKYPRLLFVALSISFLVLLASFRGYELRPEGLGNTLLLLGFYWLSLNWKINSALRYAAFLAVCVALVVAASLSFRFSLPAIFLWIAVAVQMHYNNELPRLRGAWALGVAMALSLLAALVVNYIFVDWGRILEVLNRHSVMSAPMDWGVRFVINTWTGYWRISLLVLGGVGAMWLYAMRMGRADFPVRLVNALLALALLSFYVFLFAWDLSPRGYIHSIEWILILGLALFSVRAGVISSRGLSIALLAVSCALFYLSYKAANALSVERDSAYFLERLQRSVGAEGMKAASDSTLIEYFDPKAALTEQVSSRREFCARHRGAYVVSGSIDSHPICLVDKGTYDFSGWGSKSVDLLNLPPDRELIVLSASAAQLAPLAAHYGDRYKQMINISIVEKR
ncbi:hypothetical protein [Curvibacter sp. PAE-UM]|uniref:hypothetical protein n=1 Tax=Curvibacter sp. PAE-UM TaxID=1714344 RepID=UPI00070F3E70|nr:hypothetical protein [Curvibacter sp. PAE-UM]KRI01736.1 hypothetical protein AO057_01270 [Curvibacter sp. PAE-UM]